MENWIRNNLKIIKPFPFTDEEYIVIDEKRSLLLSMFLDFVKGEELPLTVEKLKSIDPNNERGWFEYFELWEEQGILN